MLLVLYDAVGSAVSETFVTTIGKRISIPMKECNNAKRWYKNGNYISGLSFDHQNQLYFAKPSLSQSGIYTCGKTVSAELVVVEMNKKPTIMDANGLKLTSVLNVNENFELGCSFTYTKLSKIEQLPLKIKWKSIGFEENENIATEKTLQEENPGDCTSVTIASWVNFTVENASSDSSVRCQVIDQQGNSWKSNDIDIKVGKTRKSFTSNAGIPSEMNLSEPNLYEKSPSESTTSEPTTSDSTTSESTTSESTTSESTTSGSTTSEANLPESNLCPIRPYFMIILSSVCIVFLAAGLIFLVVKNRRKNSENETRSSVV